MVIAAKAGIQGLCREQACLFPTIVAGLQLVLQRRGCLLYDGVLEI